MGIGYSSTEVVDADGKAAAVPNISIGAANLKFGFGFVTSESQKLVTY